MSKTIELASGKITPTDTLTIELLKPSDMPAVILLRWPPQPSVTQPHRLPATANDIMAIMAGAIGRLSAISPEL